MTDHPAPPHGRSARLRGWLLAFTVAVMAALAPVAVAAEDVVPAPPDAVTAPLGLDTPPAVVPYAELVAAADARSLNAAVVDTSNYWVAATDRGGNLIAAEIPRPERGSEFAIAAGATPAATAGGPTVFELADRLREDGVAVITPDAGDPSGAGGSRFFTTPLIIAFGGALFILTIIFFRRRMTGGGGRPSAASHGRIRKNALVTAPAQRFADVAGCDEAVEELREIVVFLKEPERFSRVGARMPRGVVLHGPPGTGKTLLAKAVAGESGVPFFALSGSDFVDTFVGVGAARVRDLFAQARQGEEGAIIFFDEIDAIGRARGGGGTGADSEREGTLNQLLVELDGFGARDRIVVIAATNRLDTLDPALLRPGRFDRRVQVGLPAERGRLEILRVHSAGMPIADPASLETLARLTAGFAGADLANVVNEAAIMAARDGRETILASDLDEGMLRAIAGPQRNDRRIADGELEVIAWHEAGHALAAELCPTHARTQRVTILSRGDTGGLALYGTEDRALTSQQQLHERMLVAMAGRAAEELRFGSISSGAANDIEMVNRMAREAVERLGFSPEVGQIVSAAGVHQIPLSGETRTTIDREVGRLVDAAYADALALLGDHRDELDALGAALIEREQLDRADIEGILHAVSAGGRRLPADAGRLPGRQDAPVAVAVAEPSAEVRTQEAPAAAEDPEAAGPERRRPARLRVLAGLAGSAGRPRGALRRAGGLVAAAGTRATRVPGRVSAFRERRARRKRPGIA